MFELLLDTEFLTFSDQAVLVKEGYIFEKFNVVDKHELDNDVDNFVEFLLKNELARRVL